jgi:hypothetical protein
MAVVVRCTGCRSASQVEAAAVGLLVVCPRCREPFLAIAEATPVLATPLHQPVEPARQPRRRPGRREAAEPVHPAHDPHDPAIEPAGGLPVSVLIGFALLPLAIPLFWLIGPVVLKQHPSLSLAAPASLALSASVLCLAVVFTVDWTPATRIKGVLMLVGLSYFAGLSLFFLKKDMVDRAKDFFGPDHSWHDFHPAAQDYSVRLPVALPKETKSSVDPHSLAGWQLQCFTTSHVTLTGSRVVYLFGSGPDARPNAGDWFREIEKAVDQAAGKGASVGPAEAVEVGDLPGRQWEIELADGAATRIVRVFRSQGKVYFLSVEGDRLDDDLTRPFLESLRVKKPVGP